MTCKGGNPFQLVVYKEYGSESVYMNDTTRNKGLEAQYLLPGGYLGYKIQNQEIEIIDSSALLGEARIPERIEGYPVTAIHKKAFLSRKYLQKVTLPETVCQVGDWAFAHCDRLKEISIGNPRVHLGKAVFLDCKELRFLYLPDKNRTVAALFAGAVGLLKTEYLLNPLEAGSEEWFAKWDARAKELLLSKDESGYSKQVLCGEEDYGSVDLRAYKERARKKKVKVAFLRLLYPDALRPELKALLEQYLLTHTKGCESEETWKVLLEEYGNNSEYYKLFATLGCLTRENRAAVLEDIGEDHPEMKAYFMGFFGQEGDFFDSLFL